MKNSALAAVAVAAAALLTIAGFGVVFITHNAHHAFMVGDHFSVPRQGAVELNSPRQDFTLNEPTLHMAGGTALEELRHELDRPATPGPGALQDSGAKQGVTL